MGLATALILGSTLLKTVTEQKAAKAEASAVVAQGELDAANKAKEVQLRAARAQSSFLTSGLTLEGTPAAAIQGIFSVGLEDIDQITSNAGTQAKNIVSKARSDALANIMSTASGMDFGDTNFTSPFKNTGGFGNTLNTTFGVPLSTGGGGSITGAGIPIAGRKPTTRV